MLVPTRRALLLVTLLAACSDPALTTEDAADTASVATDTASVATTDTAESDPPDVSAPLDASLPSDVSDPPDAPTFEPDTPQDVTVDGVAVPDVATVTPPDAIQDTATGEVAEPPQPALCAAVDAHEDWELCDSSPDHCA
ncbi:MAG: hypothetical protein QF464_15635, partial [Myxococcota bacterium]|nr:hypothetical protein [Myxococcota bacterium]